MTKIVVANLKLTSSTTLPNSTNAQTSAPQNYLITITFNENNLDRPKLCLQELLFKMIYVAQHPAVSINPIKK